MSAAPSHPPAGGVSDMLLTVKSREIQRGTLAEMRGDHAVAARHLLAAAHLEIVLANDYEQAGDEELSLRSGLSAASCFWRAGRPNQARDLIDELLQRYPAQAMSIQAVLGELQRDYPT